MPGLDLSVTLRSRGLKTLRNMMLRSQDLSEAFRKIIQLWAFENDEKFVLGEAAETSGVQQSGDVFWAPLISESYMRSKRKKGYGDALMTATGDLRRALSTEAAFAEFVDPLRAVFGMPLVSEEADKVRYNWELRQTLFLNETDVENVVEQVHDHIEGKNEIGADTLVEVIQ